jgi:membrane protease YdiL (CAAX protease family)
MMLGWSIVYGCVVLGLAWYVGHQSRKLSIQLWVGLWFFLFAGVGLIPILGESEWALLVASCVNQLSTSVYLLAAGFGQTPVPVPSVSQQIRWGLGSIAIGVGALAISSLALTFFEYTGTQHQEQGLVTLMLEGSSIEQGVALLLIVGLAPVGEELLFRGALQSNISSRWGNRWAIVWTGFLFGLMHFESWTSVPPLIVFGMVLSWWRVQTGWLIFPVLAHFTNNALAMLLL